MKTATPSLTDRFRPPKTKVCKACKVDKPIKEFAHNIKNKDNYDQNCRACKKAIEDQKELKRKEHAKTFFDSKYFD